MTGRQNPLQAFFCATAEPLNVAVLRIVVFVCMASAIGRTDVVGLVRLPAGLRVPPPGYGPFFDWIPLEVRWATVTQALSFAACVTAVAGFMSRTSAAIACACATYVLGLPQMFGKVNHSDHHLIWFAAILAATPSGDALSIDALRAAWRRADRGDVAPPASLAYALPLRFVWLLFGLIYFFPGLSKLRAGPRCFAGENIKRLMYENWQRRHFVPQFRIDRYPLLCGSLGLATALFELSFLPCLFIPRLRLLIIAAGALFHVMTQTYLGIFFGRLVTCYVAFVDWSGVCRQVGAQVFPQDFVLTYDPRDRGQRRLVASASAFDVLHRVRYAPDSTMEGGVRVSVGAHTLTDRHALLALLKRVPLLLPIVPLLRMRAGNPRSAAPAPASISSRGVASWSGTTASIIVGSVLLAGNVYCGVAGIASWPFSIYPRFNEIVRPTRSFVEAVVRNPQSGARQVEIGLPTLVLERLVADDPTRQAVRLRALKDWLVKGRVRLQPNETLQFFAITRSTIPEEHDRPPLRRKLLSEFQASEEGTSSD